MIKKVAGGDTGHGGLAEVGGNTNLGLANENSIFRQLPRAFHFYSSASFNSFKKAIDSWKLLPGYFRKKNTTMTAMMKAPKV